MSKKVSGLMKLSEVPEEERASIIEPTTILSIGWKLDKSKKDKKGRLEKIEFGDGWDMISAKQKKEMLLNLIIKNTL